MDHAHEDYDDAIELAPRVWWVGAMRRDVEFQSYAYLIEQGDQSVLIDPGSALIADEVIRKVERVVGVKNVRWVVCSRADPDALGALGALERHGLHRDAAIVTQWHTQVLIVHSGTTLPFWRAEEHDWTLRLADRTLHFVAMPYVPSAGSFATFDETSGTLFSSNLFAAATPTLELRAASMACFDAMRVYHEHYVPSRDVLAHVIRRLRGLPVRLIAPQHGQLIGEELIAPIMDRLEVLECGIFLLAREDPGLRFMLAANRTIHRVIDALVHEQQFSDVVAYLSRLATRTTGAQYLELWAGTDELLWHFEASDNFAGHRDEPPDDVVRVLKGAAAQYGSRLILPITTPDSSQIRGVTVLGYPTSVSIDEATLGVVDQVIGLIGVGLEREVLRRSTDAELAVWRRRAILDSLTGLHNRASLADSLRRLVGYDDQHEQSHMAALMVDLDHFKEINDQFGHSTGDRVLQHVAQSITESVRPSDLVFRYGGEEFLVMLSNVDTMTSLLAAERIRARVGVPIEDHLSVSVSVGVAMRTKGESYESLIDRADQALYAAKANGRDRVEVAS
ncbi:MAG TPA: diguanylate cyclase [Acidimicrobiales bacterium]|nr:diguanylate cyclase [Acidimicrobiales bacterium]